MNQTLDVVQAPAVPATGSRAADYVALTKPGITLMVSLTAAAGFFLAAPASVDLGLLAGLLAGTLLSSGGAAALNMFVEREVDGKMDRTRNRPLPSGRLSPAEALVIGLTLSVAGTAVLASATNLLTAALGAATILSYIAVYTPLKTRSSLCTVVGAVPGALPPVMGWTAATGELAAGAAVLFLILFFWQLPHFLALAWLYRADYARAGQPMLPVTDADGSSTGRQVVLQTMALLVASILPLGFGLGGPGYLAAALLLGTGFLAFGIAFATERTDVRARRLFLASVTYLPLILAALVLA